MEEIVALDSSKQKKFVKSIKGIKKLIKKSDAESKATGDSDDKVKKGKVTKRRRKEKGLVYLSHIPHGFYENEMTQYFRQFGVVTNARVIKSKRTGRSKGYAFVEFKEPAVAEIVAETMNNYLMGKRLIKAAYIPAEKQKRKAFRRHWSSVNNPGTNLRIKMKKAHNENKDENGELKRAKKLLSNINKTKKKLCELGINYDFFIPVDIPEALVKNVQIKSEEEDSKENVTTSVAKSKKKGKKLQPAVEDKASAAKNSKGKNKNLEENQEKDKSSKVKDEKKKSKKTVTDKKTQKQKNQNLKDKGVTPMENFITIAQDSNDSDSSLEFDSDEYENILKHDDGDSVSSEDKSDEDSGSEDIVDDDESDAGVSDESEVEEVLKKKNKNKALPVAQSKKNAGKVKGQKKISQQMKRTAPQKTPAASLKKPKFEKQSNHITRNKQFKKKK